MTDNTGVLILGEGAVLKGDVKNAKRVEIYGTLDGGLSSSDLIVRDSGFLTGTVKADTATVEGTLKGEVRVQQLISIKSTGTVTGNVKYGRLAMEEGANLAASVRNVPPSIAGDLDLSVSRGRTVRITLADLSAIDPDDTADHLTFKVSNARGGFITQSGAPGLSVETFTQADLEAGRVHFAHDGSDAVTANFDVTVEDDDGATSGKAQTVKVAVRA